MSTGSRFRATAAGTISLLALLWLAPALGDRLGQDEARRLRESGAIQPLAALLERHRERLQGRLIDLELEVEEEQGETRLVYELKLLDPRGRVREVLLDAQSGAWLGEDD